MIREGFAIGAGILMVALWILVPPWGPDNWPLAIPIIIMCFSCIGGFFAYPILKTKIVNRKPEGKE